MAVTGYAMAYGKKTSIAGFEGNSPSVLKLEAFNPSNLHSLPVYFEHDPSLTFGQWVDFSSDNYGLKATGVLFKEPFKQVPQLLVEVVSGVRQGLSFGGVGEIKKGELDIFDIREVSIVTQPGVQGSKITDYSLTKEGEDFLKRIN